MTLPRHLRLVIFGGLLFCACRAANRAATSKGTVADAGPMVASIDISYLPLTSAAISRDGSRVYAVGSSELVVIDTISRRVVGRLRLSHFPWTVAVSPDGASIYVAGVFGDLAAGIYPAAAD